MDDERYSVDQQDVRRVERIAEPVVHERRREQRKSAVDAGGHGNLAHKVDQPVNQLHAGPFLPPSFADQ